MLLIDAWGWEQLCPDEKPKENVKKGVPLKLYAARDKNTGKTVITIEYKEKKLTLTLSSRPKD